MSKVILEPDVLTTQIGDLCERENITVDGADLVVRLRKVESLFAEQKELSKPSVPYEERRAHYIKTQEALLEMARIGGENEALQLLVRFSEMYFSLIPPEKRTEEYNLRIAQSRKHN